MKKIFFIMFIFTLVCQAQPYIYLKMQVPDTINGEEIMYQKLQRLNINNDNIENFPPQQFMDTYLSTINDPFQNYMALNFNGDYYLIYNCVDTSDYFILPNTSNILINELLYSQLRNKLYIFSNDYSEIDVLDLSTHQIISTLMLPEQDAINNLQRPFRNAFFSRDHSLLYFLSTDTLNYHNQIWTYSLETNNISNKQNLYSLGHPNTNGYELLFGRNGKGIIRSYNNNQTFNSYYKVYDFDSDTGSIEFFKDSLSDSYFSDNGEFLLIMETANDTVNYYHHTGNGNIYDTNTGQLVKTISVPPNGTIYTFDNYPNDIYYVLNLDSANRQPTVYNLTKLKINSISPPLALAYWTTPIQPNVLTITINGEFFTDSTVAYFNGNAKPTTFVSDSVVTFTLNSIEFRSAADYPVWVTNYGAVSDTVSLSVVNTLPNPVVPSIQCMQDNGNHTFTVHFNYNNQNTVPVGVVAAPPNNTFSPGNYYRGQPSFFLSGNHTNDFSVIFDGSGLTWTLLGNSVTANKYTIRCP